MKSLNMKKVYRAELRDLLRNRAKIARDLKREARANDKLREKTIRETARRMKRAIYASNKSDTQIARRIAILEGRLS